MQVILKKRPRKSPHPEPPCECSVCWESMEIGCTPNGECERKLKVDNRIPPA